MPSVRSNARAMRDVPPKPQRAAFSGGVTVHEIGGGIECGGVSDCRTAEDGTHEGGGVRGIDYSATGDVFASYGVKDVVGVTTIAAGVNSDQSTYDYLGRFAYLRLTQTF